MRIHPFDLIAGRVMFPIASECYGCTNGYSPKLWVVAIEGFSTLTDVLPPGPEDPEGPVGAPGPQGPPGPLIPACPDSDGDAWADCVTNPTCNPYGHPCGDCDDTDASVFPGAPGSRNCQLEPGGVETPD